MRPINEIDLIRDTEISQDELIEQEIKKNKMISNILRVVTFVVMVAGIYLFFSPIVDLIGYIPIVGGFLKSTIAGVIILGAVIVSIPLYLLTFSLAWLRYHPKTGLLLLLAVAIIITVIVVLDQTMNER